MRSKTEQLNLSHFEGLKEVNQTVKSRSLWNGSYQGGDEGPSPNLGEGNDQTNRGAKQ